MLYSMHYIAYTIYHILYTMYWILSYTMYTTIYTVRCILCILYLRVYATTEAVGQIRPPWAMEGRPCRQSFSVGMGDKGLHRRMFGNRQISHTARCWYGELCKSSRNPQKPIKLLWKSERNLLKFV